MRERSRLATAVMFALCSVWFLITLFPLYWTLITSFKTPPAVNQGATYIPFVDFDPTIKPYVDAISGNRGDFVNPFLNSTLIGLSATFLRRAVRVDGGLFAGALPVPGAPCRRHRVHGRSASAASSPAPSGSAGRKSTRWAPRWWSR